MRHSVPLVILALAVGCTMEKAPTSSAKVGGPANAAVVPATRRWHVIMQPGQEVPTSTSISYGDAVISLDGNNLMSWKVTIWNPGCETFFMGHIHQAPAGVAGPIQQFYYNGNTAPYGFVKQPRETWKGSATVSQALADGIRENPAGYYVNFHTLTNRGGALRAQLMPGDPTPQPPTVPASCP